MLLKTEESLSQSFIFSDSFLFFQPLWMILLFCTLNASLQPDSLLALVKIERNLIKNQSIYLRWGAGRSESLLWKKHTLLFCGSGARDEHGSSSGELNKDANFIPSFAVNIGGKKRQCSVCRKTGTAPAWAWLSLFLPFQSLQAQLQVTPSLSVWYGRMSVDFPAPSRKRGGFGTSHLHNDHKLPTMGLLFLWTSIKRKQPFPPLSLRKKEKAWNKYKP